LFVSKELGASLVMGYYRSHEDISSYGTFWFTRLSTLLIISRVATRDNDLYAWVLALVSNVTHVPPSPLFDLSSSSFFAWFYVHAETPATFRMLRHVEEHR
jgi:hypothetical protein